MRVVAIDTSTRGRCVCILAEDGRVLVDSGSGAASSGTSLSGILATAVAGVVDAAGGLAVEGPAAAGSPPIDAVVVAAGPGSYTGLRTGMAAALGLAHALDVPLHGVGSLDVVAHAAPLTAAGVLAVADAGRGAVYAARYRRDESGILHPVEPPRRLPVADLAVPAGAEVVTLDALPAPLEALHPAGGGAAALARAAAFAAVGPPLDRTGLRPLYVL